jgi:hypothetical protein|tara:strand:+ start:722 stop:1090 length:369 start_codon:yes stop_codon:yes gene_type:complete
MLAGAVCAGCDTIAFLDKIPVPDIPNPVKALLEARSEARAFRSAAEHAECGDADAQYTLAQHYRSGAGALEDLIQSYRWYQISAASGHIYAGFQMTDLAAEMTPDDIAEAERLARAWAPASC